MVYIKDKIVPLTKVLKKGSPSKLPVKKKIHLCLQISLWELLPGTHKIQKEVQEQFRAAMALGVCGGVYSSSLCA